MDGYGRTEDELFSSCLVNLTWETCYEQVGQVPLRGREQRRCFRCCDLKWHKYIYIEICKCLKGEFKGLVFND